MNVTALVLFITKMTSLQYRDLLEDRGELYLDLLTSHRHADLRLVTEEGRESWAHQVVLSAASQSLANILMELSQHDNMAITLVGISHEELQEVLSLIYTGELRCRPDSIDRFTEIARHLGLQGISVFTNNFYPKLLL